MRLLKSVGDSVLWLLETNKIVKANLEKEANRRGVTSDRLVFAKHVNHEKYLSQFHQADFSWTRFLMAPALLPVMRFGLVCLSLLKVDRVILHGWQVVC